MRVHITLKSSNAKVGPIPVTTSSSDTCSPSCPFKDNGCYAASGPLALHWRRIDRGERGGHWDALCDHIRDLPEGQVWRHNQAGDLPHTDGEITHRAVIDLVNANKGKRGFTYTHHEVSTRLDNQRIVAWANQCGFTINLSANDLNHADELMALKVAPVVTVLPSDATENTVTPKGHKVVICPAVTGKAKNCAECKLCAITDRKVVIGFPAHGSQKKRIDAHIKES